ncbi:MAG: hypothetical protein JO149_00800 [Gammaproteobacteria bacterium]|nr:hypothetical protein [Gammaproteobacteria bacterium]
MNILKFNPTISAVVVMCILTSKAQHEGRVRAIVKIHITTTAEIVGLI